MNVTILEFYQHLYPFEKVVDFFTRQGDELCNREFAIEGAFYSRFVVAHNAADLKRQVLAMPDLKTFHVGPIYDGRIADRKSVMAPSRPFRKELVFDIDLTDYDFLTLSKPDGSVDVEACDRAWPVAAHAVFFLQRILKQEFGFVELAVLYSGRRGVHLYVCDESAMRLGDDARTAIVDRLNLGFSKGNKRAARGVHVLATMNHLMGAVMYAFGENMVKGMQLLDPLQARLEFVDRLDLANDPAFSDFEDGVLGKADGVAVWEYVQEKIKHASTKKSWMQTLLEEVVLAYVWPRLDANVSKHLNHLLKAPLVAHPKSGRVALPVDIANVYNFNPANVPNLNHWDGELLKAALPLLHPTSVREVAQTNQPNQPNATNRPTQGAPSSPHDLEDLVTPPIRAAVNKKRRFVPKSSTLKPR